VRYAVAPGVTMGEKTYHQYVADVKKVLPRAIMGIIAALIIWPVITLTLGSIDVISFPVFTLTIILGGIFYFLNRIFIQVKYKIPVQFDSTPSYSSKKLGEDMDIAGSFLWRMRRNL